MKNTILIIFLLCNCYSKLLGQTATQEPIYWGNVGFTKLLWQAKYVYGVNYQIASKHVIGFEILEYGEQEEGGIIFADETPNKVQKSNTTKLSYGYKIPLKSKHLKIIPSIGFGQTFGMYRTDKLAPSTSSGSGWFNISIGNIDYIEIPFSGVSITPQLDIMIHNNWGGFGIALINNNTFSDLGKTLSTNNFALKVCIGKFR
jgi:hypothetical protein